MVAYLFTQLGFPYVQRASVELVLLSLTAGALGPWILMRGLGFFAHAIGTAAFPGLIVADAIGIAPQAGAVLGATGLAAGSGILNPGKSDGTRIALWLTGAMAAGALIASDISHPGAGVDTALFGSLLTVGSSDILTAAIAAAAGFWAAATGGPRWLAQGMLGRPSPRWDALLFLVVALAVLAQLSATGALLASSLLVLPATAARPWVSNLRSWQLLTGSLALVSAFIGLLASLGFDTPPGATIALTAGLVVVGSLIIKRVTKPGTNRSLRKALTATAAVAAAMVVGGCAGSQTNPIVATTPIVGSITQSIAGPGFTVKTLVPSGADPHSYEPRPSDTAALAGAKVLITSGAGLDNWVLNQKDKAGGKETVVDLAAHSPFKLDGEQPSEMDPHWFHDPRNVAAAGRTIALALSRRFPDQAAGFLQRAAELTAETRRLDKQARACTAKLTPLERNLVTDHDAFAYLAARLHLKVQGSILQSQSTVAAPSPRQIDSLAQQIKALRIKAIFPERALDPRLAKNLAKQSGASADTQLDADTLGPAGSQSGSWSGMWTGNVSRLVKALSGGRVTCNFNTTGATSDATQL